MNGGHYNGYGDSGPGSGRYGHTNGVTNYEAQNPRRPGGYGGLGSTETSAGRSRLYGRQDPRPPDLERRRANRLSGDKKEAWRRSRSRSAPGEGRQGRAADKIDDLLSYIKREWGFMMEDQCIPAQVALQLLDDTSLGLARRAEEFHDTQEQLQAALRATVNEHHQGFNSSIGTFHQIQASIQASHERVGTLRNSLIQAKSNLSSVKPEYQNLVSSSRNYGHMLDQIHVIEQVQQVPDRLEAHISEKHFLDAVEALQQALVLIRKSEMEDIGALEETKVYLSNQEHSLIDILIEELHNHLYLKSPYCEDRWKRFSKINQDETISNALDSEWGDLNEFLDGLDITKAKSDDASRNPESNTFDYIHTIIEALSKLGRLPEAVDSIEERLPVELFKIVERSNNEVQQRHPNATSNEKNSKPDPMAALTNDTSQIAILKDLLDVLYAKFEAIAEAHRAFHEVITGVSMRASDSSDPRLSRGFKELWKLYQSEIRSLLHDYLSTGDDMAHRLKQDSAGESNIFRYQRDKNKKTAFRMDMVDARASELKHERDEVIEIWQKFVPGLVSLNDSTAARTTLSGPGHADTTAAGHKLLVEPSVFNIGFLLPPSIAFLNRLKKIVPPNSDIAIYTLSSFLNDFLINVFHPQLEETLTDFCAQSFVNYDAFQQDEQWARYSQRPIFKGTVKFFEIVKAFCKMLVELTHDQLFSQLINTQMNTYYEKCDNWYRALVTRAQADTDGRQLKAAASFAKSGDVCDNLVKLEGDVSRESKQQSLLYETTALISKIGDQTLAESDLILDRKSLSQLCLLSTSMTWLSSKLRNLRRISNKAIDHADRRNSSMFPIKRSLNTDLLEGKTSPAALTPTAAVDDENVFLPLSSETAGTFDGVVTAYSDLASEALRTLHIEVRCNVLCRLGFSVRGSYILSDLPESPDEDILALVQELLSFDQEVKATLQLREHSFLVSGTAQFVDAVLVHNISRQLKAMNPMGSEHLQLNLRVLYHNLLNLEEDAEFPRARRFLRAFDKGGEGVLELAKNKKGFSAEELRALMRLIYSVGVENSDATKSSAARRALDARLAQLADIVR